MAIAIFELKSHKAISNLHFSNLWGQIEASAQQKQGQITKLAIGVEGGFDPEKQNYRFEEEHRIVLYPENESYALTDPALPHLVRLSVDSVLAADSAFRKDEIQACRWDGEKRQITKFADLEQLNNGVKVPPKGWVCSQCDLRQNLWLNLTDGTILCGRRNLDGSGGNNHAVEHYERTKYPLAVKLGTVTPDEADVYSYPEGDMVENPNLRKHLAHFGIDINLMEKTEKTMIELEIDVNKKVGEWSTIQEANSVLEPLYGSGYVGMENLGNSCYLNSVMQVLFSIYEIAEAYFPVGHIYTRTNNPFENFDFQMAKLAFGLFSPFYSVEPSESKQPVEQKGIRPTSFKKLVGKGHPEFSTKKQQDAEEFFRHIIDLMDKSHKENTQVLRPNLTEIFRFKIEDRTECLASNKVRYSERYECVLSVPLPLHKATNQAEVAAYKQAKAEAEAKKRSLPDVVRPRIRLLDCLNEFGSDEIIDDFHSPETNTKTVARRCRRLKTFPEYLMLHIQKFSVDSNWQPMKIDCSLDVPNELDLTFLKGKGPQPHEELLSDAPAPAGGQTLTSEDLKTLHDMGFEVERVKEVMLQTSPKNVQDVIDYILTHPKAEPELGAFVADPVSLKRVMECGVSKEEAISGLKATNNEADAAVAWIFEERQKKDESMETEDEEENDPVNYRDGTGKYTLVAFISHMGTSAQSGHYVCHILKSGQWVIHNDSKVAKSERPPTDLAYMYLYQRVPQVVRRLSGNLPF